MRGLITRCLILEAQNRWHISWGLIPEGLITRGHMSGGLIPEGLITGSIYLGGLYPGAYIRGGLYPGWLITGELIIGRLITRGLYRCLYPGCFSSGGLRSTLTVFKDSTCFTHAEGGAHLLQINDNNLFHKLLNFFVDVVLKGNTVPPKFSKN